MPTLVYYIFSFRITSKQVRKATNILLIIAGIVFFLTTGELVSLGLTLIGINNYFSYYWKSPKISNYINIAIALLVVIYSLTASWLPIGANVGLAKNLVFVMLVIGVILGFLWLLVVFYEKILRWCLSNRWTFMTVPIITILLGIVIWIGFDKTFGFAANGMEGMGWKAFRQTSFWHAPSSKFPGLG